MKDRDLGQQEYSQRETLPRIMAVEITAIEGCPNPYGFTQYVIFATDGVSIDLPPSAEEVTIPQLQDGDILLITRYVRDDGEEDDNNRTVLVARNGKWVTTFHVDSNYIRKTGTLDNPQEDDSQEEDIPSLIP